MRLSSAVSSNSARSASLRLDVGARSERHGRGRRGEGSAQVVTDSGEQRAAQPVGLGERAGAGGLRRELALHEGRLELRGTRRAPVDRRLRAVARAGRCSPFSPSGSVVSSSSSAATRGSVAAATISPSSRSSTLVIPNASRSRADERLAARRRRSARCSRPRRAPRPRRSRVPRDLARRAAWSTTIAHQRGDDQEDDERQQVQRIGDRDRVERLDEEEVEQQPGARAAASRAGQMPPTSATTTMSSWNASTSLVIDSSLRVAREQPGQQGQSDERRARSRSGGDAARAPRPPRQPAAARLRVRDDVHVDVAGQSDDVRRRAGAPEEWPRAGCDD